MPGEAVVVDLREVLDTASIQSLFTDAVEPLRRLCEAHTERTDTRVALGVMRGNDVGSALIARTPLAGICEVLAHGAEDDDDLRMLIDAAADYLHAIAIRADIAADCSERWQSLGFALRPDPEGNGRLRAERRHPPEPEGFFTSPRIRSTAQRRLAVELPPEGNTLPLVPEELRDEELPAFVVRWILDADEVGLLMQEFAPDLYPPVTPAVRPPSIRAATGSLASVLGDPRVDALAPTDLVPDLPVGLLVPVALIERVAAAERIVTWLREAKRVQAWAAGSGHPAAVWIVNDPWEPHTDARPECSGGIDPLRSPR